MQGVPLHADGVLLEHPWAAGAVAQTEDGTVDVQVDMVRVGDEVTVVGCLVDMLYTVRQC